MYAETNEYLQKEAKKHYPKCYNSNTLDFEIEREYTKLIKNSLKTY